MLSSKEQEVKAEAAYYKPLFKLLSFMKNYLEFMRMKIPQPQSRENPKLHERKNVA